MGAEMQVWTLDALERAAAYIVRSGLFGVKRLKKAVAQYRGPRLPEGATRLPDGGSVELYFVEVY